VELELGKLLSCYDYDIKFGEVFPSLRNLEMEIFEPDFSIRTFNALKRININSLEQLLNVSGTELICANDKIVNKKGWVDDILHGLCVLQDSL